LAAGLRFGLNDFSAGSDPSLVPSSLRIYALSAHPRLAFTLPFMEISLAPGLGLNWATLSSEGTAALSTLDFVFDADLRASFTLNDWLGIGVNLGYQHYFFTQGFDHFDLSISGEISLSP